MHGITKVCHWSRAWLSTIIQPPWYYFDFSYFSYWLMEFLNILFHYRQTQRQTGDDICINAKFYCMDLQELISQGSRTTWLTRDSILPVSYEHSYMFFWKKALLIACIQFSQIQILQSKLSHKFSYVYSDTFAVQNKLSSSLIWSITARIARVHTLWFCQMFWVF